MKNIAKLVIKHFKFSLSIWVIVSAVLAFYALDLPSKLQGDGFEMDGEYEEVQDELSNNFDFPRNTILVLFTKDKDHTASQFNEHINTVLNDIEKLDITEQIQSPLTYEEQRNENYAYAVLGFDKLDDEMVPYVEDVRKITDQYDHTMLTGAPVISLDLNTASQKDLMIAEMIGIPFALIVLIMAFGSIVAAIVPIIVGGLTVVCSLGILTLLGDQLSLSVFLLNVTPMIGLALSIDFALLFINRYKEELQNNNRKDSIIKTIRTAGTSIIFSAVCVFIGLAAMLLIQVDIFKTVAIGGMVVVSVAVIASLTLLPSILLLLGNHINKGKLFKSKKESESNHTWRAFAEGVMKRPVLISILATVILLIGIIPVKDINLTIPDETALPESYESREAFAILNEQFSLRDEATIYILASRDGSWTDEDGLRDLEYLVNKFEDDPLVTGTQSLFSFSGTASSKELYAMLQMPEGQASLEPVTEQFIHDGQLLLPVTLDAVASSSEAQEWVRDWSEKDFDVDVLIGGEPRFNQEIFDEIFNKIWYGIAIVLISTYIILLVAFRSVFIPLKAIIMNIIGLASTFGILVWIFQEGHYGLDPTSIALIIPVFVFSLVFGLSMDYEVFLISRIQEEYKLNGDNDEATVVGLASTSKIITSAALIMIVLTGAFAFTGVVPVKQIGIGIALAIFIDATIIRLLLVPSLMKLLGEWNWWLPFAKKNKKQNN
ncbi:MMPL family transporter [Bacillus sp. AGMB 02131]|uniref:MMPL family transporter n=1 Tax=Peribacillus faecalis TaxID=2772559 RepID=A0A927HBX9_9BACI|nr:MMPL family transporter [Peribacillus faecalis]MBD3110240.1 MMPL family transporter [Peribacillus faecalis]